LAGSKLIDLGSEDCSIICLGIEYCNLIDLDVSKAFNRAVSLFERKTSVILGLFIYYYSIY